MGSRALSVVAIAVFAAAAVFAYWVWGGSRSPSEVIVDDSTGDTVGTAPLDQRERIDIDEVRLRRDDDGYVLGFVMVASNAGGRDETDEQLVVFSARLTDGTHTFDVRARIAGAIRDASVVDAADPGRPFVLEDPEVAGHRIEVRVPGEAVDGLAEAFTWGAAVRLDGAEDKAPADGAAVFPAAGR